MKSTATKTAKTRRNVPQFLGLIRVSGNAQDFARQEEDLESIELEHEVQIFHRLEAKDLSGTVTLEDADIKAILAELGDPRVAGLAISSLDRLFRPKHYRTMAILDVFVEAHKPILTAREGFIEPWTDEGFDTCMGNATKAGAEWREIRRRSMKAKQKYAKLGANSAASAAYGYRHQGKRREATWVICEAEAAVVRTIFRLAAQGMTGYQIAQWLNKLGPYANRAGDAIPSARGGMWSDQVVRQTMYNPCYIGQARFAKGKAWETSIAVPAILATGEERAWWDATQAYRAKNRADRAGRPSSNYQLQKLAFCALCEKRITGRRQSRDRRVYRCGHINPVTHARICHASQVAADKFENGVWAEFIRNLSSEASIRAMLESHRTEMAASQPLGAGKAERLHKLKRDAAALEKKLGLGELLDSFEQTVIELRGVKSEIALLERELERSVKVFDMPSTLSIRALAREMQEAAGWTTYAERRGLLERSISKIWYADGEFTVEGKLTFGASGLDSGTQNPYGGICSDMDFVPFSFKGKVAA